MAIPPERPLLFAMFALRQELVNVPCERLDCGTIGVLESQGFRITSHRKNVKT